MKNKTCVTDFCIKKPYASRIKQLILIQFILFFLAAVFFDPLLSLAQEKKSEIEEKITNVLDRLNRLEKENEALKNEVKLLNDQLEKRKDEEILTEKESIKKIPKTVVGSNSDKKETFAEFGFNPGGGGFFLKGDNYNFRVLGYVQALASVFENDLERTDGNGDFSIRRARIDFLADFYERFQILVEFDGGPGTTATSDSDFGLIEARLNTKILGDAIQLRAGKFTTPFSQENFRTSRSIDTVERYLALNSLFLVPALDVQFGALLHGKVLQNKNLGYFLGVFNGNGIANANLSDNNNSKELQAKLTYSPLKDLDFGFAFDYSREEDQTLSIVDIGFNSYVSVPISGDRIGFGGDVFWQNGPYSFRAEGLIFRFDSPDEGSFGAGLAGGFLQPAYFIYGNESKGLQFLLRGEVSYLDADTGNDGDTIWAVTPGISWFINPNVRLQVNPTIHYFNGPSTIRGFSDSQFVTILLTELQFKF
ncbi:MAG: porin [Thermodesulfobacteriota bacterium]